MVQVTKTVTDYSSDSTDERSDYAVEVRNLTKYFGKFCAVDHISFSVKKGEIFGLLGPNGAGKTTTIRMLTTLLTPSEGNATILGYDLRKKQNEIRKKIGLCSEKVIGYSHLTPMENLKFFGTLYDIPDEEIEKRSLNLLKFVELYEWKDTPIESFSTGMRQRMNIIRSLIHDPELLFLDEPTLGLDPQSARKIRRLIKKLNEDGKTIILTSHYMNEIEELCDRLIIIDHGKIIAQGTAEEIKQQTQTNSLEDAFIKLTGESTRDTIDLKQLKKSLMQRRMRPHA